MAAPVNGVTLEGMTGGIPGVRQFGLNTNQPVNFSGFLVDASGNVTAPGTQTVTGNQTVSGNQTVTGTQAVTGIMTPTGGLANAGGFAGITDYSTGGRGVTSTTGLTQKQIVTTESYYAEVFVEGNTIITGVSILNGHTTNGSVNLSVGLANSSGVIVAKSATTVAQGTADAYQQIPFTSTYTAVGPAKYYVVIQGSQTTGFLAVHNIGNFGANKVTTETFGTFLTTATYATTTFTTGLGPVADTY